MSRSSEPKFRAIIAELSSGKAVAYGQICLTTAAPIDQEHIEIPLEYWKEQFEYYGGVCNYNSSTGFVMFTGNNKAIFRDIHVFWPVKDALNKPNEEAG